MGTDGHKLVYSTHATDNSPIADGNMPCHLCIITGNAIITHKTIVGKMTIGHDKAIFSDNSFIPVFCTAVHCNKLTDGGTIAYINVGKF